MSIRAVRNNNPGNINAGARWQGLLPRAQMTPEQAAESRFAVFSGAKWGFRALAVLLLNYDRLHGLNTVKEIISRWAPPSENNTAAYIKAVCDGMGVEPNKALNLHDHHTLASMCKAVSIHEAGGWFFSQSDLDEGATLALRTTAVA